MRLVSVQYIIERLLGKLEATGDHTIDCERLENLESYNDLIHELLDELLINLKYEDRQEESIKALYEKSKFIALDIINYVEGKLKNE